MTVDPSKIKINRTVIEGKLETLYIHFRSGERVCESLRLWDDDIGRILIYVGSDGYPVTLQAVDGASLNSIKTKREWIGQKPLTLEDAVHRAWALCCAMIEIREEMRQELGAQLLREAIECAEQIELQIN